ncbi:MAG: hypothetical protein IJR68_04665 [Fretibacterium sp.]|nr:hypothetical protein [Fretibacterium sp.]
MKMKEKLEKNALQVEELSARLDDNINALDLISDYAFNTVRLIKQLQRDVEAHERIERLASGEKGD